MIVEMKCFATFTESFDIFKSLKKFLVRQFAVEETKSAKIMCMEILTVNTKDKTNLSLSCCIFILQAR